jgi:NAD(P)-dependent dehydrogenase (short-subunit alcohol dehydrogenase family)
VDNQPFIDFGGRRVVVTGASSGIGRAIAVELARRGASLVLIGRDEGRLRDTAAEAGGDRCDIVPLDLGSPAAIQPAIRGVVEKRGRIFGLCHCAGQVETRPLRAMQADGLRAMMEVNLTAGLELAKTVSRRDVITPEGGSILFVASIYGWVGMAGQIGYSATKGALLAAARAMAIELARQRVVVNTLSPGLVHTPMSDKALAMLTPEQVAELENAHPLGPGRPEDVARAAAFLLAPENRWITGTDLIVDGGYTAR